MSSGMYALPLNFPAGTNATPNPIMYKLNSYHHANGDASAASAEDFDPVVQLEKEQLALIQSLIKLNARLDERIANTVKVAPKEASQAKNDKKSEKKSENKDTKKDAKKPVEKTPSKPAAKGGKPSTPTVAPWKVVEEKASAEEKNGIVACASPAFESFPVEKIEECTLSICDEDLVWVETLSKVAAKRGFAFSGVVSNGEKASNGTIKVENKGVTSVTVKGRSVCGRVSTLKYIGAITGLFSFDSSRAVQSGHVHRWLTRLDEVLEKKKEPKEVENLIREMCQFLSRFDSLSTQPHLSLPDVLIRPLLNGSLPNNVELWAKRFDSIL